MTVSRTVVKSHVAGVSGNFRKVREAVGVLLEEAKNNPKAKKLFWVGLAVGAVPFVGGVLSYGVDRHRNTVIQKEQKKVLASYYRDQVAMQLGIDPKSVGLADLELAAKVNPMIAGAVKKIDQEMNNANRSAAMASAGSTAAGFLMPGIGNAVAGTLTHALTKEAVKIGGGIAGGMSSSLFDKEELHVSDMVELIDAKHVAGKEITPMDIALLRIAQNAKLQEQIKTHYKKALHKMSEVEQQQVLSQMPELLLGAEKEVIALNRGLISPQNLVMSGPQTNSSFTEMVGNKPAAASYAAMVSDQRDAQQLAEQNR